MYDARLDDNMTVNDMVNNGSWRWPEVRSEMFPMLNSLQVPELNYNSCDDTKWRDHNGNLVDFTTKQAWLTLSQQHEEVAWNKVVWFSQGNTRHAFILWMAIKGKLQTQDRIMSVICLGEIPWKVCDMVKGCLADEVMDVMQQNTSVAVMNTCQGFGILRLLFVSTIYWSRVAAVFSKGLDYWSNAEGLDYWSNAEVDVPCTLDEDFG
ncbi:reverse transcriptase zinc-binding domain-containing protein [Artemisia annua]|uniref:Reverse transcriptase zinc-binding domain-containing protein n=1 Tax=Artemisia annua TaxID=35608 RepID=A0A2U1MW44_ARTAN|nr:reverse transcriptase zinc-binding domain-containing protein [Artemisia annua]